MSARHVAIGLAVIAIAVSGAFGGLREAAPSGPTAASPNVAINAGPWTVTVKKAQLHIDLPPLSLRDKANHWLVIVADVEVTATQSWTRLGEILQPSDVDGLTSARPVEVILLRGDSSGRVGRLHPGMREELAFVWERSGTAAPAQVTVNVAGLTWRPDALQGSAAGKQWMPDPAPRAKVSLPLADHRTVTP